MDSRHTAYNKNLHKEQENWAPSFSGLGEPVEANECQGKKVERLYPLLDSQVRSKKLPFAGCGAECNEIKTWVC